jgi:hypothetical protein
MGLLSGCRDCSEVYGSTSCVFAGEEAAALSCKDGMTKIDNECVWEQVKNCKHKIDDSKPMCFACNAGF